MCLRSILATNKPNFSSVAVKWGELQTLWSQTHTHLHWQNHYRLHWRATIRLFLCITDQLYLDSQEPGSRWFPGVDPDSLSPQMQVLVARSPWYESSLLTPHTRASRSSTDPRVTVLHPLGSVPRNNSTCHVHSH